MSKKWLHFKIRMHALYTVLFRQFVLIEIHEYDGNIGQVKYATTSRNDLTERVQLGLMEMATERYKKKNNL